MLGQCDQLVWLHPNLAALTVLGYPVLFFEASWPLLRKNPHLGEGLPLLLLLAYCIPEWRDH